MFSERILESSLVILAVVVLIAFILAEYDDILLKTKEAALRMELRNIRAALAAHRMSYNSYPAGIANLPLCPRGNPALCIDGKFNSANEPLDPFGNPYKYDRADGTVSSTTKGYESW